MPWDGSPAGGFTAGRPWLPLGPDHAACNVAALSAEPASILSLYRALIALRRGSAALSLGAIGAVAADGDLLTYERHAQDGETLLVLLNLDDGPRQAQIGRGRILLSTHLDRNDEDVPGGVAHLRAAEGLIVRSAS